MDDGNDACATPINATATNVTFGNTQTKTTESGSFNGTSSTFLSTTRPFDDPTSLTISGWFYINTLTQSSAADFFGMGGSPSNYGYSLKMRDPSTETAGTSLFIVFPAVANYDTGYDFSSTGWHHVVLKRTSGTWTALVNGTSYGSTGSTPQTPDESMAIGSRYISGSASHYMNAHIDEVKFIDSAQSDDWLDTEYNNQNDPSTFWSVISSRRVFIIG